MTTAHDLAPALEVELAPGVGLRDVSQLLPAERAPRRALSRIRCVYVRHSGTTGRPGLAGLQVHTALALRAYRLPCAPGHFWLPNESESIVRAQDAVLRIAPDDWRTPHTGGRADTHGLGILVQGDLDARPMSELQQHGLHALLGWIRKRYASQLEADWLRWQRAPSAMGKRRSSGLHLVAWLQGYVESMC